MHTHTISPYLLFLTVFYLFRDPHNRQQINCTFKKFTARKEKLFLSFCIQSRFVILYRSREKLKNGNFKGVKTQKSTFSKLRNPQNNFSSKSGPKIFLEKIYLKTKSSSLLIVYGCMWCCAWIF